ncbi:MAG: ATP-binding protein [Thermoanaerobaculia bacterium]
MSPPPARSLKQKVMFVILGTTGVALLFAFAAHVLLQFFTTRNEVLLEMSSMADVVAANSTAALAFDDARAAEQTLSSLRVRSSIEAAALYGRSGAVFATFHRIGSELVVIPPGPGPDGHRFEGGHLVLVRGVMLDGERVGTLFLRTDMSEAFDREVKYAGAISLLLIASGLVAFLVASRLQRVVSRPILELTNAARSVSERRDFSVRVPFDAPDEIGSLSSAFNTMLGQIQAHETALEAARRDLEAKVRDLEHEITQRKQAEEALKKSEEQLAQAQKMEAIGRLAGGVAHDFNNLLTVINGYSDLLLRENAGDRRFQEKLEEIRHAGERAAGLTTQLLAFGRKQMIAPRILDMVAVIGSAQKMLHRLIGEDIHITVTLDPRPMSVLADPGQLDQVILNLAANARDAMPQGGELSIDVSTVTFAKSSPRWPEVLPGAYVSIRFADTGFGMDPETLSHVFEPFFTTKEVGKGTGLGLSTVYGIVKQNHGHITVDSFRGHGTTFEILFPALSAEADGRHLSGARPRLAGGSETVLIVEDEGALRGLVLRVLRDSGYVVLEAPDGPAALAVADAHEGPIHLVLTDIVLPGMNGRLLAEALAARRPGIKILFMSGYTDEVISHQGLIDEGIPFIAKPFKPSDVASMIRTILDHD